MLKEFCEKKLKEAEGKWMVLKKKKNGEIITEEIPSDKIPDSNEIQNIQEEMF